MPHFFDDQTNKYLLKGPSQGKPPWSLARLVYTGLGLGLAPKAPGTFGTFLGLPLFWLLVPLGWGWYGAATAAIFVLGCWAAHRAELDLDCHDAPQVVIDEVVGYLVTMFMAPDLPWAWVWGFLFFRFFDILKPWPVSWADRKVAGSLGVMLDDVLAGLYGLLAMRLVMFLFY